MFFIIPGLCASTLHCCRLCGLFVRAIFINSENTLFACCTVCWTLDCATPLLYCSLQTAGITVHQSGHCLSFGLYLQSQSVAGIVQSSSLLQTMIQHSAGLCRQNSRVKFLTTLLYIYCSSSKPLFCPVLHTVLPCFALLLHLNVQQAQCDVFL